MATQNIYDDPDFLDAYRGLDRSIHGLDGAPEWPTQRSMLPSIDGRRVLDLGCGFGWFSTWAADAGAASILAVDVSERMLERARRDNAAPTVVYEHHDLESIELDRERPDTRFDLAYSSLALHYIERLSELITRVHRSLVHGGSLVCSVEHPIYTAPTTPDFITLDDGTRAWPVDGYFREGPRSTDWLVDGVIKHHRIIETYVHLLHDAGFTLARLVEWGPDDSQIAEHPEEPNRPNFLLLRADKP